MENNSATLQKEFGIRTGTQDELAFQEVLKENCYRLEKFPPHTVVIDVGAHIGCFALACIAQGAERIYCYEPDPDNFAILQANMRTYDNGFCKVKCIRKAVTGRTGTVQFMPAGNIYTAMGMVTPGGSLEVDCVTLDHAIMDANISGPENLLIKIDAEFSEYAMLGNAQLLRRCKRIIGETHEMEHWGWERLRDLMLAKGFSGEWEENPRAKNLHLFFLERGSFPESQIEIVRDEQGRICGKRIFLAGQSSEFELDRRNVPGHESYTNNMKLSHCGQ